MPVGHSRILQVSLPNALIHGKVISTLRSNRAGTTVAVITATHNVLLDPYRISNVVKLGYVQVLKLVKEINVYYITNEIINFLQIGLYEFTFMQNIISNFVYV